jgi:hypothetical protein
MDAGDRERLKALGFSAEVIERAEAVLAAWGVERLFATCADCGKPCLDPDLPRRKDRKKLPADLFHRYELCARRGRAAGEVLCFPCDDFRFERAGW